MRPCLYLRGMSSSIHENPSTPRLYLHGHVPRQSRSRHDRQGGTSAVIPIFRPTTITTKARRLSPSRRKIKHVDQSVPRPRAWTEMWLGSRRWDIITQGLQSGCDLFHILQPTASGVRHMKSCKPNRSKATRCAGWKLHCTASPLTKSVFHQRVSYDLEAFQAVQVYAEDICECTVTQDLDAWAHNLRKKWVLTKR